MCVSARYAVMAHARPREQGAACMEESIRTFHVPQLIVLIGVDRRRPVHELGHDMPAQTTLSPYRLSSIVAVVDTTAGINWYICIRRMYSLRLEI
jgi:hypothetical protein